MYLLFLTVGVEGITSEMKGEHTLVSDKIRDNYIYLISVWIFHTIDKGIY